MNDIMRTRLLVVDDDPAFGRFVKKVGRGLGFDVMATADPDEFRAVSGSWSPNVVVLDLSMPGVDGVELLRHLAGIRSTAHVIIASGLDDRTLEAVERLGAERGLKMAGVLAKPTRLQDLRDLLSKFLYPDESRLIDDCAEAIRSDQLFLQYQPKLDCRLSRLTAVEALVRWRHPTRGVLPPDQFIQLAEASGLINSLTDWVVTNAARQGAAWQQSKLPLTVAVNISAKNTEDIELPDRLVDLCRGEGLSPDLMILELTETGAMRDPVQMMDVLTRLRVKGFRLSIDDFGTGYSSLVQLQRMPFSELKIDRSFVMQMNRSKDCRVIVEIVIDLARKLGLQSVAEGVEDQVILDELIKLGCDGAQGYHLSRPVDAARVADVIRAYPIPSRSAA